MASTNTLVQSLATAPFVAQQQVLDTNGPFSAGDHTISTFATNGAFILPAGNYPIGGTYGVIVQASTFPASAGRIFGWNDAAFPTISGDEYKDRIAQVVYVKHLPITSAGVIIATYDVHLPSQLCTWSATPFVGDVVGLHVFPGFAVELFWMCIL